MRFLLQNLKNDPCFHIVFTAEYAFVYSGLFPTGRNQITASTKFISILLVMLSIKCNLKQIQYTVNGVSSGRHKTHFTNFNLNQCKRESVKLLNSTYPRDLDKSLHAKGGDRHQMAPNRVV